jgi:hypothetical protein
VHTAPTTSLGNASSRIRIPQRTIPRRHRATAASFITMLSPRVPLGVKGGKNRAKLPPCVQKRITALYPDATGVATKVGYKRARDGEEPPSPPDLSADLW